MVPSGRSNRPPLHECPTRCSGREQSRQVPLHPDQFKRLSKSALAEIGVAVRSVYRCTYCGCVYLREGDRNRELGFLDNAVTPPVEGWKSHLYP